MEELLSEQQLAIRTITRALPNIKKIGKTNITLGIAQGRLAILQESWNRCRELHTKIAALIPAAEQPDHEYFAAGVYDVAEEHYLATYDYLSDRIASLTAPPIAHSSTLHDVSGISRVPHHSPLPRMQLPTFSGDYASWESFRDLFESMVLNNESLTNAQRLYYLKLCLTGEASHVLKHVAVTDTNYQTAWSTLKNRYDNARVIIQTHLHALFTVPAVGANSVKDLKRLRDTTEEAISALSNLKRPVDKWDDIFVYLVSQRLDSKSRSDWEMSLGSRTDYPTYLELDNFVTARIRALEAIQPTTSTPNQSTASTNSKLSRSTSSKSHLATQSNSIKPCIVCKASHSLHQCPEFKQQSVNQRRQIARDNRCCFNCLAIGHYPKKCPSKYQCGVCQKRHHTLLHAETAPTDGTTPVPSQAAVTPSVAPEVTPPSTTTGTNTSISTASHFSHGYSHPVNPSVLMATAWVIIRAPNGRSMQVRALVDQGSESPFVSESIAKMLQLPRQRVQTAVTGLGGTSSIKVRSKATFTVESYHAVGQAVAMTALVISQLTTYTPPEVLRTHQWTHLRDLELADPFLENAAPIDLLIGSDLYGSILLSGVRKGPPGAPIAQCTIFGWILSGPVASYRTDDVSTTAVHHCTVSDDLNVLLRNFWEIESISQSLPHTEDEKQCEEHFIATHTRHTDGRYQVCLPWKKSEPLNIGNSMSKADACLTHLEKRFRRDPSLSKAYHDFLDEYESLGHMAIQSTTSSSLKDVPVVCIPHHPVVKDSSSTTRLRVVFNASSITSNGTSLNDHMHTGPKLQRDLPDIVVNWRSYRYVYTADIAKMYRQILIHPDDTHYQCIRWRKSPDQDIRTFKLLTVTYGTASAPYLALRVLLQLALDDGDAFPLAKSVLNENFYVDDVLFGADTIESAESIRIQLTSLLKRGCFHLRKWTSNHPDLLLHVPAEDHESAVDHLIQECEALKFSV